LHEPESRRRLAGRDHMDPSRVPLRVVGPRDPIVPGPEPAHAAGPRDRRALSSIGRTARLELVFEARRGRTILAHAYAEPPFHIARTFDLDGAAYAILVCSAPGVFGGDTLTQSVHVGGGACVVLASQAAVQAHPAP